MRILARLFTRSVPSSVTMCEACGDVCTPTCRATAPADRQRTDVLNRAFPR
jgi:hypothetical protein